ncbi:multiple sugar transport system permease protein [Microbacterium sp. W4I4]|uniref:carbohydrate ABC transporter permease n=1 Tax=Microbacterium sp. W4I4 TaxID=3042295 RepID=UPI0027822FD0|nr:carbohydrate ABC transporter permease [Microbacterium sp. W4I4]MDQ0614487.1 multiple sugar transport system permease protein [Microbacterium sp. W4I4]
MTPTMTRTQALTVPSARKRRFRWSDVSAHAPLIIAALVTLFPFFVMLVISVQPGKAISLPGSLWPQKWDFSEFARLLSRGEMVGWIVNTTIYSVVSVVLVLVLSSMAAYAFAKLSFPGRSAVFMLMIAMLMVPYHLTLIPQFIMVSEMGGLNTHWGLILPTIANVQALFLMRQFIAGIPQELIDAARIDGAGEMRIFWQIILPQTKPILATLGVFVFLWHWNDFLWPLVANTKSSMYTLTVGLSSLNEEQTSLAVTMAGAVITFVPIFIIFIFLQRYFVRGVTMSGIK